MTVRRRVRKVAWACWLLLPRQLRDLPKDLWAIVMLVVVTNVLVFTPYLQDTPVRIGVALVFILFAPGYALIAAMFPERGDTVGDLGIGGIERLALSIGSSIGIVPGIGLVLHFTPWGIRLVPVVLGLSGLTLLLTGIGALRRWELPADERFTVPFRIWYDRIYSDLFEPENRWDAALTVVLALSLVVAGLSVGYAATTPSDRYTEFYLLTQDGEEEYVMDDFPTDFQVGESGGELTYAIVNHEFGEVEYTVVIQLQAVSFDRDEDGFVENITVHERDELERHEWVLDDGESEYHTHTFTPTYAADEQMRVQYLLYTDGVPEDPSEDNAYRDLQLLVSVEE